MGLNPSMVCTFLSRLPTPHSYPFASVKAARPESKEKEAKVTAWGGGVEIVKTGKVP